MVVIDARLVSYLRRGLRFELGDAAERIATIMLVLEDEPTPNAAERSHAILEAARTLRREISLRGSGPQEDIELDLSASAQLVLRALDREHSIGVDCLQERAAYGLDSGPHGEEVQALGQLVTVVKRIVLRQGGRRSDVLSVESPTNTHPHSQRTRSARGSGGPRPRR